MLPVICILIYSVSLVTVGILIAANNPEFAQKFKTRAQKLREQAKNLRHE